jgi:hypothetical protein
MKKKNSPTPAQVEEFKGYMEHYQRLLNLLDWRIEHSGKSASKGALAEVLPKLEDRLAVWSLGKEWYSMEVTSENLRISALHECLHIFFASYTEACFQRDEPLSESLEHSLIVVLERLIK